MNKLEQVRGSPHVGRGRGVASLNRFMCGHTGTPTCKQIDRQTQLKALLSRKFRMRAVTNTDTQNTVIDNHPFELLG